MFVATVINFFLFSLYTGSQIATSIVSIREALILKADYPLSEKPVLVENALRDMRIVFVWAVSLPVSIKLSLPDLVSTYARWRYVSAISSSFGGLGLSFEVNSR